MTDVTQIPSRFEEGDAPDKDEDLLALDEALTKLAEEDRKAARVVEMQYFAGMGHEEIAAALNITRLPRSPTVDLRPRLAKA